jgi:hypothetical protein
MRNVTLNAISQKKEGKIADGYAHFILIIKIGNSASQKHPVLGNPERNDRSGIDTSLEFEKIEYFVVFPSHNYYILRCTAWHMVTQDDSVDGAEGTLFTGSQSKQQGTGLLMI